MKHEISDIAFEVCSKLAKEGVHVMSISGKFIKTFRVDFPTNETHTLRVQGINITSQISTCLSLSDTKKVTDFLDSENALTLKLNYAFNKDEGYIHFT